MNDVDKLAYGKGSFQDTKEFFKFLFLIDLGDRTNTAIAQLIKETSGKSPTAKKFNELKRNDFVILHD